MHAALFWRRTAIFAILSLLQVLAPIAHGADDDAPKAISIVGTSRVSTKQHAPATITVPPETKPGDVIIMFVGGSGPPYCTPQPSPPKPHDGWFEIVRIGERDINQKAYFKVYTDDNEDDEYPTPQRYTISRGKSMFVSMVSLRNVDTNMPVIDVAAGENTMPGLVGASRAPPVNTEQGGIVLASFAYDDPQLARVTTPGFTTLISFRAQSADGMAVGASNTTTDGTVGPIDASGHYAEGAGNEVAIAISFRVAGDDIPSIVGRKRASLPLTKVLKEETAVCDDGRTIVLGESFCSVKEDEDGTYVGNEAKNCAYFRYIDVAARLKRSCNEYNPGAQHCSACREYMQKYPREEKAVCGDGRTIVLGKQFCYVKKEDDGTYIRKEKDCTYFDYRYRSIKNHCNEENIGSVHCSACREYMQKRVVCGDGKPIVLGKQFCYVRKKKKRGIYIRNYARKCAFFETGTADKLKKHCNEDNPGSGHCGVCKNYMK